MSSALLTSGSSKRIAVIGAGWAGLAAATELIGHGHQVSLFEASRQVGGRARSVDWHTRDGRHIQIDNGQHILIGAYRDTLALMKKLGIDPDKVLQRIPLRLEAASGFKIQAPRLPPPFHLLWALLSAKGLSWPDRVAAIKLIQICKRKQWRLADDCTVDEWMTRHGQTPVLRQRIWIPLCIAALNTPPEIASAQVFLNVLRDSMGADRTASDLLLPTTHLNVLFPQAALSLIQAQGSVQLGTRVGAIIPGKTGIVIQYSEQQSEFDSAVIAVSAHHVPALLQQAAPTDPAYDRLVQQCEALSWQPITTVYLLYPQSPFKPGQASMLMLDDDPEQGHYGQWIFDRERLGGQTGLVAVVISAEGPHRDWSRQELATAVAAQVRQQMHMTANPMDHQVITEKRATFSCVPGLSRPGNKTPDPRIVLAGDYTGADLSTDLPATLESAVRSGLKAACELSITF